MKLHQVHHHQSWLHSVPTYASAKQNDDLRVATVETVCLFKRMRSHAISNLAMIQRFFVGCERLPAAAALEIRMTLY